MIETQNKLWDNARNGLKNRRKTLGKTYYIVSDNPKADNAASSYDEDLKKTLNGNVKFAPNSVFLNSPENTTNSGDSNKTTPTLNESKTNPVLSAPPIETKQTTGGAIKNNITGVLSKKYGSLDTKHVFDGIDDKDVENNISTAESTIRTNIDSGRMSKDVYSLYPNMRDGLALSYAAADKGKNKAAKWAKEAAYTEINEPLIKKTDSNLLPNQSIKYTTPFDYKNNMPGNKEKKYLFLDAFNYSKENKANDNNSKKSVDYSNSKNTQNKTLKNNSYNLLKEALTKTDLDAGIKIAESSNGEYNYDYTDVIMNRVNEVLPDFLNHKIMSYSEYYKEFSNWSYSPTIQEYFVFYLKDYIFFYKQVNHGAPWDIKRDAPWKQQFGDIKMPYYEGNDDKDEKFLFRGQQVTREDLGNILYGYLGSAMGISDKILYQGGGIAASWTNVFDGDLYNPDAYYGDSQQDHDCIKKGIEMFYEDYPKAKM